LQALHFSERHLCDSPSKALPRPPPFICSPSSRNARSPQATFPLRDRKVSGAQPYLPTGFPELISKASCYAFVFLFPAHPINVFEFFTQPLPHFVFPPCVMFPPVLNRFDSTLMNFLSELFPPPRGFTYVIFQSVSLTPVPSVTTQLPPSFLFLIHPFLLVLPLSRSPSGFRQNQTSNDPE